MHAALSDPLAKRPATKGSDDLGLLTRPPPCQRRGAGGTVAAMWPTAHFVTMQGIRAEPVHNRLKCGGYGAPSDSAPPPAADNGANAAQTALRQVPTHKRIATEAEIVSSEDAAAITMTNPGKGFLRRQDVHYQQNAVRKIHHCQADGAARVAG